MDDDEKKRCDNMKCPHRCHQVQIIAGSHCMGLGTMGYYTFMQNCSRCTRNWNGTRPIMSVPFPCSVSLQLSKELRIDSISRFMRYSFNVKKRS